MAAPAIEVRARRNQPLGMPPARFLRDYWQKRPLLVRNAFADFAPPLAPDELAGLACMDGALARIVVHGKSRPPDFGLRRNDGKWKVFTGPFNDATFTGLPDTTWTLLVQDADKWDEATAALLKPFGFIPSWRIDDVMISYATDGGGVGAHVDQYDVFLLQGLGQRHWSIDTRPNPPTAFRDDVPLKLLREFHPTHAWMLDPGDMLYLPPGVPHDGVAVGECMTFSIGMRAPAAGELLFDFAAHVAESLPESRRFADPELKPAGANGEIDDAALQRARRTLGSVANAMDKEAFADWFGRFITRYRVAQGPSPRARPIDRAVLARRLPSATLERDPWSRFAWARHGRYARLYAGGAAFGAPLAWARVLAGSFRKLDGAQLAKLPHRARGVALLAELINAGHLRLRRLISHPG
ncbi:MAG: JmjC domain-containing protein [Rhodanobacteraceae bacterium]